MPKAPSPKMTSPGAGEDVAQRQKGESGIEQSEMTGGVSRGVNPLRFAALSSSPFEGAFRHLAVSRAKPPPFGGGGIAVGDDGEGSSRKV